MDRDGRTQKPKFVRREHRRRDLVDGFRADFSLVDIPVFNGSGYPGHHRGITTVPGLYFLGLGWLWTWGSGRFSGIAQDAHHIVENIGTRFWTADLSRAPQQKVA